MPHYKYKAFICYSHKNKGWTRWLQRALESDRVPQRLIEAGPDSAPIPRQLALVFRDREDLPGSPDLSDRINEELPSVLSANSKPAVTGR